MRKYLKFLFLYTMLICSLIILFLTTTNSIKVIIGSLIKIFKISDDLAYTYFFRHFLFLYNPNYKLLIEYNSNCLLFMRNSTDLILFAVVISSWLLYFLQKYNFRLKLLDNKHKIVFLFLIGSYFGIGCYDILWPIFFEVTIKGLDSTFYLFFLKFVIISVFLLNIITACIIFMGKDWSFLTKTIITFFILLYSLSLCFNVCVTILFEDSLVAICLYKPEILGDAAPYFKEHRTILELVDILYKSYILEI